MGADLVADGATFRVWAPGANHVYVVLGGASDYTPQPSDELVKDPATGDWTGFVPGVTDGTQYRFWVSGPAGSGLKRDPWARELELYGYPDCDGIVRQADLYPWHDAGFEAPAPSDLIVYQFHIGVFYARDDSGVDRRPGRVSKFLDAVDRIPYLQDLGVTAVQPLPFAEFQTPWSLGYNGTDLFSPEMDYCVAPSDLEPYVDKVNGLLAAKGCAPWHTQTSKAR
jgi:1,4-alpha-glucan branching enzyme